MPWAAHLREARTRGIRAGLALAVAAVLGFVFADPIMDVLRAPIEAVAQTRDASLNYDSVTGAFDLRMKVALFAGIALSSPVWLYELLAFLTPGLTRRERRYTLGFFAAALPLFAAGCATGFVLFPHMVELLTGFAATEDSTILQAATYLDFVMKIVLATGVAFVLPVVLVMLNLLGMLPAATLLRGWRYIVVAIVVFSALVTPAADALSMFLVAVPMSALFGAAVAIAWLHDRRRVVA
ncbi:twin-arginine translocase subunit TatC [Microbacterium marinum]